MIVVCNTTPLIALARIRQVDLLKAVFGELHIAQAVYDEIVVPGHELGGAQRAVTEAAWIKIMPVQDRLAVEVLLDELDLGEAETIVLARELQADWVVMDERKGRRKLTQLGLNKIGTVGMLLKAKQLGLIPSLRAAMEHLRAQGFSVSQTVIDAVLQQAGE